MRTKPWVFPGGDAVRCRDALWRGICGHPCSPVSGIISEEIIVYSQKQLTGRGGHLNRHGSYFEDGALWDRCVRVETNTVTEGLEWDVHASGYAAVGSNALRRGRGTRRVCDDRSFSGGGKRVASV